MSSKENKAEVVKHNYEKIRLSLFEGNAEKGKEKEINWTLEVKKRNKKEYEELISWKQKESEWDDTNLLIKLIREPEYAVLNMKAEREGLKQWAIFRVKELGNIDCEVVVAPSVTKLLDNLPLKVAKKEKEPK